MAGDLQALLTTLEALLVAVESIPGKFQGDIAHRAGRAGAGSPAHLSRGVIDPSATYATCSASTAPRYRPGSRAPSGQVAGSWR
jgi:hypothetical protein